MNNIFLLIIALMPSLVFGETKSTLSDSLWSRVDSCHMNFEDMDDDGKLDFDQVDDSKNGYLEISGSYPTCGCTCSSTVGAYKNTLGEYTFVQSDSMMCSWERKISSNKKLKDILPTGFGINSFMSKTIDATGHKPIFFIDFEIPREGTDTKVKIKLIPLGIFPEGNNLVTYDYHEDDSYDERTQQSDKVLGKIYNIANNISDDKTLTFLLNGEFKNISAHDNEVIFKEIRDKSQNFKSIDELRHYLIKLKKAYDLYAQFDTDELTLGWDKVKSKFFIKEKGSSIEVGSFKDFLILSRYYSPLC